MPRCFVFDPTLLCVNYPTCHGCNNTISIKEVFSIEPNELRAFISHIEGDNNQRYAYYSLRCISCLISDKISEAANHIKNNPGTPLSTTFRDAIKEMVLTAAQNAAEAVIPSMVRAELKKILREETADPHGTFSPD